MFRNLALATLSLLLLPSLISPATVNAPGHFAAGVILGEPTGISAKYVIDERFAAQGALGFSIIGKGLWFSGDFLMQFHNVLTQDGRLPVYIGVGMVIQDRGNGGKNNSSETSVGIRVVAGLEYRALERVSIFGEASAQPFFIPSIRFGASLAIGARYWF
jgi:hypothetical protein